MYKFDRLTEISDWIPFDFVERETTDPAMMRRHLRASRWYLAFEDSFVFEAHGINRHRTTVHNWVPKADLQLNSGPALDYTKVTSNRGFCRSFFPSGDDAVEGRRETTRHEQFCRVD